MFKGGNCRQKKSSNFSSVFLHLELQIWLIFAFPAGWHTWSFDLSMRTITGWICNTWLSSRHAWCTSKICLTSLLSSSRIVHIFPYYSSLEYCNSELLSSCVWAVFQVISAMRLVAADRLQPTVIEGCVGGTCRKAVNPSHTVDCFSRPSSGW